MLNLEETLTSELPQARYLVLELAALLDRLDEAAQRDKCSLSGDERMRNLRSALNTLNTPTSKSNRVEQILRVYSETEPPTPDSRR
jgi:hypothetical protein